jgi:hypothetical protein
MRAGKRPDGDSVWHTNDKENYWCGYWGERTPEELYVECHTIIKDLIRNHPELKKFNEPYLIKEEVVVTKIYNPCYGDNRICICGHPYYRHFDSYEHNDAVGCKYCGDEFVEKIPNEDQNEVS